MNLSIKELEDLIESLRFRISTRQGPAGTNEGLINLYKKLLSEKEEKLQKELAKD